MFFQLAHDHLSGTHPEAVACNIVAVTHDGAGGALCALEALRALDVRQAMTGDGQQPAPVVYDVDHVYPGGDMGAPLIVLYADVTRTAEFAAWHQLLVQRHEAGELRYVLRHRLAPSAPQRPPLCLSGYGVELAVKKTEYLATDDTANAADAGAPAPAEDVGDVDGDALAGFDFDVCVA